MGSNPYIYYYQSRFERIQVDLMSLLCCLDRPHCSLRSHLSRPVNVVSARNAMVDFFAGRIVHIYITSVVKRERIIYVLQVCHIHQTTKAMFYRRNIHCNIGAQLVTDAISLRLCDRKDKTIHILVLSDQDS